MKLFLLRRGFQALLLCFVVATLVFLLIHLIPGDPVDQILGDFAESADREALREVLGLNQSLFQQYLQFWRQLFSGTWGQSFSRDRAVLGLILERIPATAALTLPGFFMAGVVSFLWVLWGRLRRVKFWESLTLCVSVLSLGVPLIVLAPAVVWLFSIEWRLLPVAGSSSLYHLVLPSLCFTIGLFGLWVPTLEAALDENLKKDFVKTAKAKGLTEWTILSRHVLRNSLLPLITVILNSLAALLSGAVISETLFDWPGVGKLFYEAFLSRDFPLLQGLVIVISFIYVFVHFLADVLYAWADPRIDIRGEIK